MKEIQCRTCGQMFESTKCLRDHIESIHPKAISLELICNLCEEVFDNNPQLKDHKNELHRQNFKCEICNCMFNLRCDLENHIKTHEIQRDFKCHICEKVFYLEWRMKRHVKGHFAKNRRLCHYYNNLKDCPFEDIGCKFTHDEAEKCKFGKLCAKPLCQFKHTAVVFHDSVEDENKTDPEDTSKQETLFCTSTPKRQKLPCDNCIDKSQCDTCFVDQYIQNTKTTGQSSNTISHWAKKGVFTI